MAWKNIPVEIQELIVEQIPSILDLARLRRVSKHFQDTVLRSLYKTIEVRAKNEWQLDDISLDPLLRTLYKYPEYLKYIRDIRVLAPIHQNIKRRCVHSKKGHEYREYTEFGSRLITLLDQLRDNSLRNFSWELGICISSRLFSDSGHLLIKQNQLESLSLVTDPWCQFNGTKHNNQINSRLADFTSLRSISWRGIQARNDFMALQGALFTNSSHVETLELDLVKWTSTELYYNDSEWSQDQSQHFLAYEILQLGSTGQEVKFPTLKNLSLSGVSFHIAVFEIASAFNFSELRSLKLNKCPYVENLLEAVLQASQPVQLTTLELVVVGGSFGPSNALIKFLGSFKGLRAFYLLMQNCQISEELWESILLHQPTLDQFVYHERPQTGRRTIDNLVLPWNRTSPSPELVNHNLDLRLSYVGLCCSISQLNSSIGVFATDTLTLLHIRRTGNDIYEKHMKKLGPANSRSSYNKRLIEARDLLNFAEWAFGPYGFPCLRVLAYGDFSYGNRYAQQNTLLCRKSNSASNSTNDSSEAEKATFEVMKTNGSDRIFETDAYREILEACPVNYLYN